MVGHKVREGSVPAYGPDDLDWWPNAVVVFREEVMAVVRGHPDDDGPNHAMVVRFEGLPEEF